MTDHKDSLESTIFTTNMNEAWDKERFKQCAIDRKKLNDVHLAICGDSELGITGLVKDVHELKSWRRRIDVRVASIAGGISGIVFLVKHMFEK
jgi:hypothetical protein